MARTARRPTAALVVAVGSVSGALLAGCGVLPDDGAPTSGPDASAPATSSAAPPTPSADAAPTVEAVRSSGLAAQVGDRTVLHALAEDDGTVTAAPDGDVTVLAVTGGPAGTPAAVLLAAPPDATIVVQDDGSFVVLASDGTFLGGAARPVTADGGGVPVRITATDDGALRASADDGDLQIRVGVTALAGAEWGEREGGRSLAVAPTPWARAAGQAGESGVWAELVAAVPEADTPGMHDQLTCHVLGAPDKETWNLEPWRPDVGFLGVLAAACNPT